MLKQLIYKNSYLVPGLFLIIGLCLIILTHHYPIGDFGNYYYGSKLFAEGKFGLLDYQSIHHFNNQIANCGEHHFFENYTPVPPFSLLAYLPFVFLTCIKAKLVFNLISLLFFCFSLHRFLNSFTISHWQVYLIPFIFLYPLYNCIYQGQAYLLITAFLMESFLASHNSKYWLSAFYIGLSISLKIFPAFIILYFILKKEFRTVFYSLLITILFLILTFVFVGAEIISYYLIDVFPRLINNDIIGAYYHGNQSIYTFLLNLFSLDEVQNSNPWINFPWLVPVIEGVSVGILVAVLFSFRKHTPGLFFGLVIFCSVLIGRYHTTYGMLILIPFMVSFLGSGYFKMSHVIVIIVFALAVNAPVGYFLNSTLLLKFSRLIGLVVVLGVLCALYKPEISLRLMCIVAIIGISFKCRSFSIKPAQYFAIQNTKGILFDYTLHKDSITLISTLGEETYAETRVMVGKVTTSDSLYIEGKNIMYNNKVITETTDQKKKPFLYNDSLVVFLSDLNQAIGFYKLRVIAVKP